MTTRLKDEDLFRKLSVSLAAVAESVETQPVAARAPSSPSVPVSPKRRGGRRAALVGAAVIALGAPIGAVAWIGSTPDWNQAPEGPQPIETLRVGDEEIWLVPGEKPTEDVQVLSEDSRGPEWGAFTMRRHADAPVNELQWGTILLEEEQQLVFYTSADETVDSLRILVDGVASDVTSHRVGNGSYSIFAVDASADQLVITPRRAGDPLVQARVRMDVPKP